MSKNIDAQLVCDALMMVMAEVTVDLSALINIDHDHFLNLHPDARQRRCGNIIQPSCKQCEFIGGNSGIKLHGTAR